MMDMPFDLDTELVHRAIATSELLTIFFPWFGKALIVDTRHDATTPPAVYVDDMVGSAEERIRSIMRLRPQFPRPVQLTALPWPAGTDSFLNSGAFDQVVRRCYDLGYGHLETNCRRALGDLQRAEYQAKLAYVRGDHGRTLYERQPRQR